MVIVSNIYEVAFRSYSHFSTEIQIRLFFDINTCLHSLRKSHVTGDLRVLWLSNMLKLFALLY